MPVFEMTNATSPGVIIEATMICWCESSCAPQGTPNSGNFCCASRATIADAPKPKNSIVLAASSKVDGLGERVLVEMVASPIETGDGVVEDLLHHDIRRIGCEQDRMGGRRAERQALRQAQLEVLEAAATDRDAEADHGGLADAGRLGGLGNRGAEDAARIGEDQVGDFAIGLAQVAARHPHHFEDVLLLDARRDRTVGHAPV